MSLSVTLADLIARVRSLADMENSTFVDNADELTVWINEAYSELYDILVAKGVEYYVTSTSLSLDGSSNTVALPADFYKLVGVDYTLGGRSLPMQKFIFQDRHKYQDNSSVIRYRLVGNSSLMFAPTPSAQSVTLWYVPAITKLDDDADTLDGVNGWEEYIVVDAAMKCLIKEESDISELERRKAFLIKRIEDMAGDRDTGTAERITDVTGGMWPDAEMFGDV
jgi:hypothetical protein